MGLKDQLVGRAHECDYPAFVKNLPVCSDVNFDTGGTSGDIDRNLKAHIKQGHSLYKVDAQLIEKLNPDMIIAQSHCDVCAVTANQIENVIGKKLKSNPKLVSLQTNGLQDVWAGIRQIAEAAHVPKRGEQQVRRIQRRMEEIYLKSKDIPDKPRVACIEWINPLMMSGNWVPELVKMAGGINIFGEKEKRSEGLNWSNLVQADPDIILIMPCGFDLKKTREEAAFLSGKPDWNDLKAVLNNRVFLIDGNQYINRPGPRLLESLEIMAEIFHPEVFHFGHQNEAWEYFGFGR